MKDMKHITIITILEKRMCTHTEKEGSRFEVADCECYMLHSTCEDAVGFAAQCKVVCCMLLTLHVQCVKYVRVLRFKIRIGTVKVHYFV